MLTAGSGPVQVAIPSYSLTTSSTNIDIPYAVRNTRNQASQMPYRVSLKKLDALGGYTFRPAKYITGDTLLAITKAMNDWKCQTGVQFTMGQNLSDSAVVDPDDSINTILFAYIPPPTNSTDTILWRTILSVHYPDACTLSRADTVATIYDIDMVVNTATLFYLDTSDVNIVPAGHNSLMGVARHEFGHAMGLCHVNDNTLMYYKDPGGSYHPRQIQHPDQNGGIYMIGLGPIHLYPICTSPQNWPLNCPSLQIQNGIGNLIDNSLNINIFPNPFNESITIRTDIGEASQMKVNIFNLLGQAVFTNNYSIQSGLVEESINVAPLSTGMYIIQVTIGGNNMVVKLLKR